MLYYILAAAAVLLLAAEYLLYRFAISRKGITLPPWLSGENKAPWDEFQDRIDEGIVWLEGTDHEEVDITSWDGIRLHGHLYLCGSGAERTAICCHGFRSSWKMDFSLSVPRLLERGFDVLLIDQRAHGDSEGEQICFGVRESRDVRDWCGFVNERFGSGRPVYLTGISMGAGTVMLAAGLDLPDNVKGIVADCGYTSPSALFKYEMKHLFHVPWQPFLWLFKIICRRIAGFDPDISAADALRSSGMPVLLVHGTADDIVPVEMSYENRDACMGYCDLLLVEGQGHGCAFPASPEEYLRREEALVAHCEKA